MFLDGFVERLRDSGIPVGMTEVLELYEGLEKGLAPDLDALFVFARLCLVRRVEHLDAYERAFLFHFAGIDLPRVAEGDPELFNTPQFAEWLREAVRRGELPPDVLYTHSPEELMEKFWQRIREQLEEHHGGSKWIGTGGNSPFGHSGNSRGGVRVMGRPGRPGMGSAMKVVGERRYIDYADETVLRGENLSQALATLKRLTPEGPRDELDVGETIDRSAKAGGEIELAFARRLVDKTEVLLLMDNGGWSMMPFVELTRLLFGKVRDRFRRQETYFFHNTVYSDVWQDPERTIPTATEDLLKKSPDTVVLFVGDASMGPHELVSPYGAIDYLRGEPEPSIDWLRRIAERFPRSVWLNPIPEEDWDRVRGARTISAIGEVFPMEDLTLGGIKRAVERLVR
jgi:uncharacterized protein with von Willebrand factor type A (vWA) domain